MSEMRQMFSKMRFSGSGGSIDVPVALLLPRNFCKVGRNMFATLEHEDL